MGFTAEWLLPPTVKKIGHVRILFGFGAVELFETGIADDLGQGNVRFLRGKGERQLQVFVVGHHAGDLDTRIVTAVKALEILAAQGSDDLAWPIFAEIKKDQLVAIARLLVGMQHDRPYEFIGVTRGIGAFNGALSIETALALAMNNGAPSQFSAFPAPVTIHAVVAPGDGGNGAARFVKILFDNVEIG